MIKEKEIEEMAKEICKYVETKGMSEVYISKTPNKEESLYYLHNTGVAEALYSAGYRKIPDDATVLLVDKNNKALDEKTVEFFITHNDKVRQKTAKHVLSYLYKTCKEAGEQYLIDDIEYLMKQYNIKEH